MTRRSWRDLERSEGSGGGGPLHGGLFHPAGDPTDLHRAADLVPGTRLTALVEQREALERRIRVLSGASDGRDSFTAARFPVMTFAERLAEQRELDARRERLTRQGDELRRAVAAGGASGPAMPDTPLAQRMQEGLAALANTGLTAARTGLAGGQGASGGGLAGASRRRRADILGPARRAGAALEEARRPLRDFGRKLDDARRQMADLDRRLASEGVTEGERSEIRRAMGGDQIDKVGGVIGRANEVLDTPKRLVDGVANRWAARERELTAPMDDVSSYATTRDRRLSTDTGGSGDLFERMTRDRERALERRRQEREEEERDRQRRERASDRSAERRAEAERNGRASR